MLDPLGSLTRLFIFLKHLFNVVRYELVGLLVLATDDGDEHGSLIAVDQVVQVADEARCGEADLPLSRFDIAHDV